MDSAISDHTVGNLSVAAVETRTVMSKGGIMLRVRSREGYVTAIHIAASPMTAVRMPRE